MKSNNRQINKGQETDRCFRRPCILCYPEAVPCATTGKALTSHFTYFSHTKIKQQVLWNLKPVFRAIVVTYVAQCDTTLRSVVFHEAGTVDQLHGVSRAAGDQSGGGIRAIAGNKEGVLCIFSTDVVKKKVMASHIGN